MSKIIMFAGAIGAGKAFMMNKKITELKEVGNSICMLSFADPIKEIVKEVFGYDKNGNIVDEKTFLNFSDNFLNNDVVIENPKDTEEDLKFFFKLLFDRVTENHSFNYSIDHKTIFNNIQPTLIDIIEYFKTGGEQNIKKGIRLLMQIVGTEIGQEIEKEIWPEYLKRKIEKLHNEIDYFIIDDWRFLFEYFNAYKSYQHVHNIELFYVDAIAEVRAKRRGISVEELEEVSQHKSELESLKVIKPFMEIYFPDNIIINNVGL